jgi:DNA mismatch repair ATPase MutS
MSDKAEKFYKVLNKAKDVNDIYELISIQESNAIEVLCGLIGAGTVCKLFSTESLNSNEEKLLHEIRQKQEFEKFLEKELKMKPEEFYEKLLELQKKSNPILEMRFEELKKEKRDTWRSGN